jgi:hypothetical protein
MKIKLVLIIFCAISITSLFAQRDAKITFGILGGVNFQNMTGKDFLGNTLENDMILGYHAGVEVQVPIAPEFYFQPSLLFSTKGSKNVNGLLTTTYKLSYLEVPLNFVYKASLGNGFIMVGFGPYVAYGIGGKVLTEGGSVALETSVEFKSVVEVGDPIEITYYKAFDAGGNIFVGYELANGIFAKLNAQLGMLKINPEDQRLLDDQSSIKHTGFGVSLGYRF